MPSGRFQSRRHRIGDFVRFIDARAFAIGAPIFGSKVGSDPCHRRNILLELSGPAGEVLFAPAGSGHGSPTQKTGSVSSPSRSLSQDPLSVPLVWPEGQFSTFGRSLGVRKCEYGLEHPRPSGVRPMGQSPGVDSGRSGSGTDGSAHRI